MGIFQLPTRGQAFFVQLHSPAVLDLKIGQVSQVIQDQRDTPGIAENRSGTLLAHFRPEPPATPQPMRAQGEGAAG